jgi:Putative beta-barrel porin 2
MPGDFFAKVSGRSRRIGWGLLLAATASIAAPALASPSTMGDDRSIYQPTPSGLAAGGRGFALKAELTTLYDGNMLRRGDGFAARPGEEKADYRISPSVSGEFGLPVGRQRIYVNGLVGRDYFVRNEQLDRNRYQLGGGLQLAAGSSCTALIDGDIGSRQILLSEVDTLVPNAQETLSYGASATCRSAVGLGFGGSIRRTQIRNDNATREVFDLDSTAYGLSVSYGMGSIGLFSLSGAITDVSYVGRQILTTDGQVMDDGLEIISGRLGYERAIGARLALALGLSYYESRPDPTTVLAGVSVGLPPTLVLVPVDRSEFSGMGYDASITYRPSSRMVMVLAANRNVSASVNVGALAQVRTSVLFDVDYMLGSGLKLGAGGSYDEREYNNAVLTLPDRRLREQDKISRVYANIGYDTSRLLSLAFEVAYQDRRSLPVEFSFDSFSARLNVTLRFGRNR